MSDAAGTEGETGATSPTKAGAGAEGSSAGRERVTLIEDIEDAASRVFCRCRDFGRPCNRERLATRLRYAALRLQNEITIRRAALAEYVAKGFLSETHGEGEAQARAIEALELINGGPAVPAEPSPALRTAHEALFKIEGGWVEAPEDDTEACCVELQTIARDALAEVERAYPELKKS